MKLKKALLALGLVGLFLFTTAFAQPQNVAIISMHGKWGAPPGPLANFLHDSGYRVVSPTMPWSRNRNYDVDYGRGLEEIHQQVERLRAEGYRKIVLIGHSFGANGVLAYMTQFADIDGAVLLAPGHVPDRFYKYGISFSDVNQARKMVSEGSGNDLMDFTDPNSGDRKKTVRASASIYLSYFDPAGLGNMPLSASQQLKEVPVLCIMSSEDRIAGMDESYLFNKLKSNTLSRYKLTNATHLDTPGSSAQEVLEFLKTISQ